MEHRYFKLSEVATRSENDSPVVEGFFVRYDDVYQVADGATESIERGALTEAITGDVRALYNHNTDIVLGRTSAGTLTLRDTEKGLWGSITINANDSQAMDIYARIARGDVSGCSFGFDIPKDGQRFETKDDGTVHWTITKVDPLYEVSPCVFPAYQATHIEARQQELEKIKKREAETWRVRQKKRLEEIRHGIKSADDKEEARPETDRA